MPKDSYGEEHRFQQLIDSLPTVAVQGYNSQREVIYWNDASASLYGYSKQEALGEKLEDLIIPQEMRQGVIDAHKNWVEQGVAIPAAELQLKSKSGGAVPVFSSHVMLKQDSDDPEMFCVDVDLTEQYKSAQQLKVLANQDPLTELPNRRSLESALERRISEATRFGQQFSVLFIDLDRFKDINDTMGHYAGDLLLKIVAERLSSNLRKYDLLSRFGGDEFVVLLPQLHRIGDIEVVAQKFISDFDATFHLEGQDIYMTASIGISVFPENGNSVGELLKNADTAMYQAKESGRNCYQFFASSMNEMLNRHRLIVTKLHQSLQQGDFQLVYQPHVDLKSNAISSCEALLRCNPHSADILMSPGEFIPVAEQSDLIIRIGRWVLEEACRQLAEWRSAGLKNTRIDINVSGKQLIQSDFIDYFRQTLKAHGLAPGDIGIELTEHALISVDESILEQLRALKESGVSISLDDFGTGYSSLSYLKHFPVDILKIDQSFIKDSSFNADDMAIMEAIVQVGHKMGLKIVVEGVETAEQKAFCQSLQCDLAQGYHYYRPMPPDEFIELVRSQALD